jgi:hypothetical protein
VAQPGALLHGVPADAVRTMAALEHALVHRFGFLADRTYAGVSHGQAHGAGRGRPGAHVAAAGGGGGPHAAADASTATRRASDAASHPAALYVIGEPGRGSSGVVGSVLPAAGRASGERSASVTGEVPSALAQPTALDAPNSAEAVAAEAAAAAAAPLLAASPSYPGWFRQYVHASGVAFVRLHGGGAHWIPNRITPGKQQQGVAAALAPWAIAARSGGNSTNGDRQSGGDADALPLASFSAAAPEESDLLVGGRALYRALADHCDALVVAREVLEDVAMRAAAALAEHGGGDGSGGINGTAVHGGAGGTDQTASRSGL